MFFNKLYLYIIISIILSSCGGGGTSNTESGQTTTTSTNSPSINTSYQGQRSLVTFNTTNQLTIAVSLINSITHLANASNLLLQPLSNTSYQSVTPCAQGGQISVSGTLNSQTQQGILNYTAQTCVQSNQVMEGTYHLTINRYEPASMMITDAALSYDSLNQKMGNDTLYPRGIIQLKDELANRGQLTVTSQLTYTYSNGLQILDTDLTLAMTEQGDSISGQLCINSLGCMSVKTPYAFMGNGLFEQGQVILSGQQNSSMRFNAENQQFWLDIDSDGDGLYETTTTLNNN